MKKWTVGVLILTMIALSSIVGAEEHYGGVNIAALNTGNIQFKGVMWCKKYFDVCVLEEKWTLGVLQGRTTVTADQFVTMQMGITAPTILEKDSVGQGRYRITFVYDQNQVHELWTPMYKDK